MKNIIFSAILCILYLILGITYLIIGYPVAGILWLCSLVLWGSILLTEYNDYKNGRKR